MLSRTLDVRIDAYAIPMTTDISDATEHAKRYAKILIVGAESHDIRVSVEHRAAPMVHTCETLAPKVCRCGELHAPTGEWDVLVHCGSPATNLGGGRTLTLALVGSERDGADLDCHWIAAPAGETFAAWAGNVVSFVLDTFCGDRGPIRFALDDVAVVLAKPGRLRVALVQDATGVMSAAATLAATTPWLRERGTGYLLGLYAPPETMLRVIDEALRHVGNHLDSEARLTMACLSSDSTPRAVLLG